MVTTPSFAARDHSSRRRRPGRVNPAATAWATGASVVPAAVINLSSPQLVGFGRRVGWLRHRHGVLGVRVIGRYVEWVQCPPARRYLRRGWPAFFSWRNFAALSSPVPRAVASYLSFLTFLWSRGPGEVALRGRHRDRSPRSASRIGPTGSGRRARMSYADPFTEAHDLGPHLGTPRRPRPRAHLRAQPPGASSPPPSPRRAVGAHRHPRRVDPGTARRTGGRSSPSRRSVSPWLSSGVAGPGPRPRKGGER